MRTAALLFVLMVSGEMLLADDISPVKAWRVNAEAVAASSHGASLDGLLSGQSAGWGADGPDAWFAVKLPADRRSTVMLTLGAPEDGPSYTARLSVSADSTDGRDGEWRPLGEKQVNWRMAKFEIAPVDGPWLKVACEPVGSQTLSIDNVGLYDLAEGRRDYWLVVGASIEAQCVRQDVFSWMVREYNGSGWDPVIFNLAAGGFTTTDLVEALPGFLAEHPRASYVCINIGGNNVIRGRPWPGGADVMRKETEAILRTIDASGKIPILTRLSYHMYRHGDGRAAEEDEGTLPYIVEVQDPLIAKYCPLFYDKAAGRGVVDAYGWFREHPEELLRDGIHATPKGELSWNRLWARDAGRVVYGTASR